MKKILAGLGITFAIMICTMLPVAASRIETVGINNDPQAQAEMLHALGLLQGTGSGFALDRGLTRAEAAVLITRFLGAEEEALSGKVATTFTDVPAWADGHVAWLAAQGITNGVGNGLFGSDRLVTYHEFATLLARAAVHSDDYISVHIGTEAERVSCDATGFTRADAVGLLTRYLSTSCYDDTTFYETAAKFLVDKNVFTPIELYDAAKDVYYRTLYRDNDRITLSILDVPYTSCTMEGLFSAVFLPEGDVAVFACTNTAEAVTLYRLDIRTLEPTVYAVFPPSTNTSFNPIWLEPYKAFNDRSYFILWVDGLHRLLRIENETAEVVLSGTQQNNGWNGYSFSIAGIDGNYLVLTNDGERFISFPDGAGFIYAEAGYVIEYNIANGECILTTRRISDWKVITNALYIPFTSDAAPYLQPSRHVDGLYSNLGAFTFQDGHLTRISTLPVKRVFAAEYADGTHPVILTESGEIVVILDPAITGENTWREEVRLSALSHGISIFDVTKCTDTILEFNNGLEYVDYNTYRYQLVETDGHIGIRVLSFILPHEMRSDTNIDAAQKRNQEQARLDALGFDVR